MAKKVVVTPPPSIEVAIASPQPAPGTAYNVVVSEGQPGQRGPTGPTGPTGPGVSTQQILDVIVPAVSYKHTQNATSNSWTINHNLKFFPNVTVFDSAGSIVEGEVIHTDNTSLTVNLSVSISGTAVLS